MITIIQENAARGYASFVQQCILYLVIPASMIGCTDNSLPPPSHKAVTSAGRIQHSRESDGRIQVKNLDNVDNLLILQSNPQVIDPELQKGRWLLLVYSVLSVQDVDAANRCAGLAHKLTGDLKVAMRPITTFEEPERWLPDYQKIRGDAGTPWWIIMDSGRVVRWKNGWMSNEEVVVFARE